MVNCLIHFFLLKVIKFVLYFLTINPIIYAQFINSGELEVLNILTF